MKGPVEKQISLLLFLFGLALLVRIAFVSLVSVNPTAGGDPHAYAGTAENILTLGEIVSPGGRYAYRMPGYPVFLAVVWKLVGLRESYYIFLAQSLIGSLGVVLLFYVASNARGLLFGVIASVLWIFHPVALLYTQQILTEAVFTTLLLLITYLSYSCLSNPTKRNALFVGIAMGVTILFRPETLLYSILFISCWIVEGLPRKNLTWQQLRRIVLVTVTVVAALVGPWVVRNWIVIGAPVLSTNGGITMYQGNNPQATGAFYHPPEIMAELDGLDEVQQNRVAFEKSLRWIAQNPGKWFKLLFAKWAALFRLYNNAVMDFADIVLLPFIVAGGLMALSQRKAGYSFTFAPILGIFIVVALFHGESRYRAPIYPFALTLAAIPIEAIVRRIWAILGSRKFS